MTNSVHLQMNFIQWQNLIHYQTVTLTVEKTSLLLKTYYQWCASNLLDSVEGLFMKVIDPTTI